MPMILLPIASEDDRRARDIQSWPSWTECMMWDVDEPVYIYYTTIGDDLIELSTVPNPGYPSEEAEGKGYYLTILPKVHEGARRRIWQALRPEDLETLSTRLAELRVQAFGLYHANT